MMKVERDFPLVEWDDSKRRTNIQKHQIDFADAARALNLPHVEFETRRNGEIRILAVCPERQRL